MSRLILNAGNQTTEFISFYKCRQSNSTLLRRKAAPAHLLGRSIASLEGDVVWPQEKGNNPATGQSSLQYSQWALVTPLRRLSVITTWANKEARIHQTGNMNSNTNKNICLACIHGLLGINDEFFLSILNLDPRSRWKYIKQKSYSYLPNSGVSFGITTSQIDIGYGNLSTDKMFCI